MRSRTGARAIVPLVMVALSSMVLVGCGGGGSGGTTTLQWYGPPDSAGATDLVVKDCNKQSNGAYKLVNNPLPSTADGQREQLVRRMAAKDSSVDLMTVDPPYTAELANAGWLHVFSDAERTQLLQGVLASPIKSAVWKNQLVAAPWEANTQLLWYNKSVAQAAGVDPTSPDFTWDKMIDAAIKTHTTVAEQGNRYEGYMVWVNALVLSAGGAMLTNNNAGRDAIPAMNSDAGKTAARIIKKLATSSAADPALSSADEGASLATFESSTGGFLLNWPYVYATIQANVKLGSVKKSVLDNLAWARYPAAVPGHPSAPPLGGGNVAISKFSTHEAAAFAALKCIISPAEEKANILLSGNPIANGAVYDDPQVQKLFPMATLMRDSINAAGPRPVTPYYGDVSAAVQRDWHPESSLNPNSAPAATAKLISDVLHDRRLL
jgi:multiple sugar transport system substrate-binding protein